MGENIAKKPSTFKNISGTFPHRINAPNLVCQSKQFLLGSVSGFSTFSLVPEVPGVQLGLQRATARNQTSTSPSHPCGEQNRSKPS